MVSPGAKTDKSPTTPKTPSPTEEISPDEARNRARSIPQPADDEADASNVSIKTLDPFDFVPSEGQLLCTGQVSLSGLTQGIDLAATAPKGPPEPDSQPTAATKSDVPETEIETAKPLSVDGDVLLVGPTIMPAGVAKVPSCFCPARFDRVSHYMRVSPGERAATAGRAKAERCRN